MRSRQAILQQPPWSDPIRVTSDVQFLTYSRLRQKLGHISIGLTKSGTFQIAIASGL